VHAVAGDRYAIGEHATRTLAGFDVVLQHRDPPYDMAYVSNTRLLEKIQPQTLVMHGPF
jgi:glutathione synthase